LAAARAAALEIDSGPFITADERDGPCRGDEPLEFTTTSLLVIVRSTLIAKQGARELVDDR